MTIVGMEFGWMNHGGTSTPLSCIIADRIQPATFHFSMETPTWYLTGSERSCVEQRRERPKLPHATESGLLFSEFSPRSFFQIFPPARNLVTHLLANECFFSPAGRCSMEAFCCAKFSVKAMYAVPNHGIALGLHGLCRVIPCHNGSP